MKIVVIGIRGIPDIPGGIERHCEKLYPRLVEKKCEVIVLGRQPYIGKKCYEYAGVKIVPLPCPRHKFLEALLHTALGSIWALKYKPDLVHFHAVGPSFFVVLSKLLGCKVVATHHGFDYDRAKWGLFAKLFIKKGEHHLCKAHGVITISHHIEESIKSRHNCSSVLIPNGVDIVIPSGMQTYLNKWKIHKKKYFLFAGRFVPEKCIDDLIDAYKQIKTDWNLVIAGDSDHEDSYSRKVKELGRNTHGVILTGYIKGEELQSIYGGAGAFVLPSSHEGLPIALLEALSYGLPCIVSDIPANRAVSHPSIRYFPIHEISTLTSLLYATVKDKYLVDSTEIISFIRTNYNWDTIAHKTFSFYKNIIENSTSVK